MSNYRIEGTIRKLIIGNQKEGFKYEVGKHMDKAGFTVNEIIFNETHFDLFGEVRYEVYVKKDEEVRLWKSFINQPVMLEFFV
jgi:hypothetical protein